MPSSHALWVNLMSRAHAPLHWLHRLCLLKGSASQRSAVLASLLVAPWKLVSKAGGDLSTGMDVSVHLCL